MNTSITASPNGSSDASFEALLTRAGASGGLDSEDLRNAFVPLLEAAIALQEEGFVGSVAWTATASCG